MGEQPRPPQSAEPSDPSLGYEVLATIETDNQVLDLPLPKVALNLHVQVRNNHAIFQIQADAEHDDDARAWADALEPDRVLERRTDDNHHLWLLFRPVPDRWADTLRRFDLRHVEIRPDGRTRVSLRGRRSDIQDLVADMDVADVQVLRDSPDGDHLTVEDLTPRQETAVRTALDSGYYEVPRRVSLTELAETMGLSPSSLSELLRRAERSIIDDHLWGGTTG